AVEEGKQVVAKREFSLLEKELEDGTINQDLVLRKPHLERAQAMLEMAKNEIARARLALDRTTIPTPFNAVVIEESIEVGQLVTTGESICQLAGTDAFWVRVTLPFEDLRWVRPPKNGTPGSKATVFLDKGNGIRAEWVGTVERLLGDLDPDTRMARALVRVEDPLGHRSTVDSAPFPLLLGSFVSVNIDAGILKNVLTIPRKALHGSNLRVVDSSEELQIRPTTVLWKQEETLFVKNVLEEGDEVIVSDLRAALPGMKVAPQRLPTPDSQP
ncbi:MAG: HlyD family efflux transporter periplasmic adaptor subunit, partial [Verrucomicrobiota bacterium]